MEDSQQEEDDEGNPLVICTANPPVYRDGDHIPHLDNLMKLASVVKQPSSSDDQGDYHQCLPPANATPLADILNHFQEIGCDLFSLIAINESSTSHGKILLEALFQNQLLMQHLESQLPTIPYHIFNAAARSIVGDLMRTTFHLYCCELDILLEKQLIAELNSTTRHLLIAGKHFDLLSATDPFLLMLGPFPDMLSNGPATQTNPGTLEPGAFER